MSQLINLAADTYFLVGAALFVFSLLGGAWILKSLHKEPEPEFEEPLGSFNLSRTFAEPELPRIPPRQAPPPAAATAAPAASLAPIQDVIQRLEQLETKIQQIAQKLEETPAAQADATRAESGPEVQQLSAKVDKIYQILSTLSGPDSK